MITRRDGLIRGEVAGSVHFLDSEEHFDNGLCRLLGLSQEEGEAFVVRWLEFRSGSGLAQDVAPLAEVLEALSGAWSSLSTRVTPTRTIPLESTTLAGQQLIPSRVWAAAIADANDFMMVGPSVAPFPHAWLVDAATGQRAAAPLYEEDYFEGGIERVGYGSYANQAGWRIEKGRRQARHVSAVLKWTGYSPSSPLLLDVGCGYGYFRNAVGELGWSHHGLEVSDFAARASREMFGFDTQVGQLVDVPRPPNGYDAIVMWDFIEHLDDPDATLRTAHGLLCDRGLLFIRTPNLLAAEAMVFGSDYHSLKLEHLHMFSAGSLAAALVAAGLAPVVLETESHLLQGFLGSRTAELSATQQGSDFFVAAERVATASGPTWG